MQVEWAGGSVHARYIINNGNPIYQSEHLASGGSLWASQQ